ncbi:hypothetical protein [Flavihumibacter sp. ZG627]|uniref:hypothetical protein n=1 Tax=Flavihumibacter sp. ZG627 TaxID=1463156 RepID=UPI00057DC011|nr:hypothetical protein [Flavihumibacter sp. ZG627]
MKRILTVLVMGMGMQMAIAQESGRDGMHHGNGEGGRMKGIELTEAQKVKMEALRKEHREEMMAILTPEQRQQLEKQKAERSVKRQKMSGARMEKMKTQLNLSADQSAKMDQLNKDFQAKTNLIKANETLAQEEQRKQMKALAEEHRSNMKAILSPEQQEILKRVRKEKGPKKTVK